MGGLKVRAAFVGRLPELERLDDALSRTVRGDSITVLCGGEAGIGKTRLVTEFADRARASGAHILSGGCVEMGPVGLPYGPFAEAFRGAVASGCLDPASLHPSALEQLTILVPDLSGAGSETAAVDLAGLGQVRLFEAVLAALEAIRAIRPVVLIIEDLQWADRSTMDLLAFLIRNVETVPLLMLITIRTDEIDRAGPIASALAELARRPTVERFDLEPLDYAETVAYLHSILGSEPEVVLAARIQRRSDGNPYYIEQLAWAHLDGETDAVPSSLRDILLTQLSRQPGPVQDLLEVASIAGPLADEELLATVLSQPDGAIIGPLRSAVRSGVLVRRASGTREVFGFRHALMGEAVEADLLDGERRRLHARCAEALSLRRPEDGTALAQWAARIAHHRERSGTIDATIEASIEAAVSAAAVAAHRDALDQYKRAIRLVPATASRRWGAWDASELFGRAASCAAINGEAREAARLSRLAVEHLPADADPWRHGALLTSLSEHLWIAGDPGFVDALTDAVDVIPAEPPTTGRADALISLGFHHQYRGDTDAARTAFMAARDTAIAAEAPREEALARCCLTPIHVNDGEIELGEVEFEAALAALRRAPAIPEVAVVYMDMAAVASWCGREQEAVRIVHEGLDAMRRHGFETFYGGGLVGNGAEALVSLGRLREAADLIATTASTSSDGYVDQAQRISSAAVAVALGDLERARDELAGTNWPDHGDSQLARYLRLTEAELAIEDGRVEAVEGIARAGLGLPPAHDPTVEPQTAMCWLAVRALADLAERARARREPAAAAELAARGDRFLAEAGILLGSSRSPRSPMYRRSAAFVAMAVAEASRLHGRPDPAAWQRAIEAWAGLNAVLRVLYLRIREAEARLEAAPGPRADRADVAAILVAAHADARRIGAVTLVRLAGDLARRARVDLGASTTSATAATAADPDAETGAGVDVPGGATVTPATPAVAALYQLTGRELEILALLGEGLTNRQIGERLFISPKTAGVHVSNILGKLEVGSRVHAATVAHRLGIVANAN